MIQKSKGFNLILLVNSTFFPIYKNIKKCKIIFGLRVWTNVQVMEVCIKNVALPQSLLKQCSYRPQKNSNNRTPFMGDN